MARSGLANSAAFAALATATAAHGTTIVYVDQSAPGVGDGHSWNTAFTNLQTALSTINGQFVPYGLEIRIAHGTYRPDVLSIAGNGFSISPGTTASGYTITIKGGYAGRQSPTPDARDFVATPTVLSGDVLGNDTADEATRADNAAGVVLIASSGSYSSIALDGFTIRDGWHPATQSGLYDLLGKGGGVQIFLAANMGNITLRNCVITHNFADRAGGGVAIARSSLAGTSQHIVLDSCTISDNQTRMYGLGGGVYASCSSPVLPPPIELINCDVLDNRIESGYGAGFASWFWSYSITRSRVRGNVTNQGGAAFHCVGANVSLVDSLVADNRTTQGTASGGFADSVTCLNSTVDSLSAADLTLTNSIVGRSNSPSNASGASARTLLTVTNSMVHLAFQSDGHLSGGGTLSPSSTGIFPFNPQFVDPDGPDNDPATWEDNDYRLSARSPAVDAGVPVSTLPPLDAGGQPRLRSGIIGRPATLDLGCYESQATLCPADLDADGGVTVDDVIDFLRAFEFGEWTADLTRDGVTPTPDGAVTIDDLLYFLARVEAGC